MAENPYTPPRAGGEPPPPADEGISFNDYDLERVSRATTWMRRVSSLQFLLGGIVLALTAVITLRTGARSSQAFLITVGSLGAYGLLLVLGGAWLRQSCVAFYDGIMANAESGLATGFRKLRLYLIAYGTFGLIGLVMSVVALLGRR